LECASNALCSGNTNFTILFSGMAIDCYLSHLYFKWRDIEELQKANIPYNPIRVEETINEELLNIRDFLDKTKAIAKMLYPAGVVRGPGEKQKPERQQNDDLIYLVCSNPRVHIQSLLLLPYLSGYHGQIRPSITQRVSKDRNPAPRPQGQAAC